MCRHPNLPLEGVNPRLLLNFTSTECHMLPQPADEGVMMVCGCQGEQECNDKLIFDKGVNGEHELKEAWGICSVVDLCTLTYTVL